MTWELIASWNWDAIIGWPLAIAGALGLVGWLIYSLFTSPTVEFADEDEAS